MDVAKINAIIANPQYQPILGIVKGARNGLVCKYSFSDAAAAATLETATDALFLPPDGAKVRFPHALVMTLLFHQGRP